jgi:hypothetical protein
MNKIMRTPAKPFADYKWRWAVLTPTEGLNDPTVFFGVLRALRLYEGTPPNSSDFIKALSVIQAETKTRVDLVRTQERNLIRNSGQYWKAFDLLGDIRGAIELTDFGRKVADGLITKAEFASTVVKRLELPSVHFEEDRKTWEAAGLRIKPLELLLQIFVRLRETIGPKDAFLTPNELIKIVIPLAGAKAVMDEYVQALHFYRTGKLDISSWPDCAPGANDKRMAREFLLFLLFYDFCEGVPGVGKYDEKFFLAETDIDLSDVDQFAAIKLPQEKPEQVAARIRGMRFLYEKERKRVMREVLTRPNQPVFRNNVLLAYNCKCLVSGVSLESVLEAAHIIPVPKKGPDQIENGICFRSDIHLLFDTGHLRIDTSGHIHLSEDASQDQNYGKLPKKVEFPKFVNLDFIHWRWQYD